VTGLAADSAAELEALFIAAYEQQFGRRIPDLEVEALSWALRLSTAGAPVMRCPPIPPGEPARPAEQVAMVDPDSGMAETIALYIRDQLAVGAVCLGPCLIVEDETTTLVTHGFTARIDPFGSIVMTRT
jgi:N-methylhydantoinase A